MSSWLHGARTIPVSCIDSCIPVVFVLFMEFLQRIRKISNIFFETTDEDGGESVENNSIQA